MEQTVPPATTGAVAPPDWLNCLREASEYLLVSGDPRAQLRRLAELFGAHLGVHRVSILLMDGEELRLAAGVGLPSDLNEGDAIVPGPDSVTAWVLRERRSRLVVGDIVQRADTQTRRRIVAALCVPLMQGDRLLGAVNFTSLSGGRELGESDLATAEVLAAMLALAIANSQLLKRSVENERLAAIGMVTANVSHCAKNILQLFKGAVFMLRYAPANDAAGSSKRGEALEILQRATIRLESLIGELLDFSKTREPEPIPVHLPSLFEDAVVPARAANERAYAIEIAVDPGADNVIVDGARLSRALANLVSNAIDVMPEGGTLRIEAAVRDPDLVISVADSGPGLDDHLMAQIFQPFFSTKGSKGTGLGLAMVAKFCEENGGRAIARRDSQLRGLRIDLVLPYCPAPGDDAARL